MLREMFYYHAGGTVIHRLDPRVKLVWVVAISVAVMLLGHPVLLAGLFLVALVPWALARPPWRCFRAVSVLLGLAMASTITTQGLFYYWEPRTALLTLVPVGFPLIGKVTGGVCVYREGLTYGAVQSLRLLTTIATGFLVVITTHPSALMLGATRLRVPPKFAFMLTVALRFLPLMIEEMQRILVAQQVRGLRLRGARGIACGFGLAMLPLVIGSMRRARQLALAAEVRAFRGERTTVDELRLTGIDWGVIGLAACLVGAGVLAVIGGYGARTAGVR